MALRIAEAHARLSAANVPPFWMIPAARPFPSRQFIEKRLEIPYS
jgi:hypothetical protein